MSPRRVQNRGDARATSYLQALSGLMLGTAATEAGGSPLSLDAAAELAVRTILAAGAAGRKVMLAGNGGSAAIVSHAHNDLNKAVGVRALVFTEPPLLTAIANDHGYERVIERPLELWADPEDVLIIVSSSGESDNVLRGARAGVDRGCRLITMTGFSADNRLRQMGHLNYHVASDVYGYVETAHGALLHYITDRAVTLARSPVETGTET